MLDFTSWQRLTAFYTLTSGAKYKVGFATRGQYRSRGYDLTVPHRNDRHEVENFRAILHALRIATWAAPRVTVAAASAPEALSEVADLVVFHLWASGQQSGLREWPEERWIELAQRLAGPETVFAITGAPSDFERTEPFVARMRSAGLRAEPFAGADGFRGLARLLKRARLVVSVNTGVMHLAAIVGAPTVSINGPTNNRRWGPMGPRGLGIIPPGAGCGYLNLGFEFKNQATDCMERVTVDMVLGAAAHVAALPAGDLD
jgi:ADP-heptose:LPS heptosyltransferase